ncbi:M28 family metallopeptidase [Clostridium sp.]|uniref:M28 family metallopeptidase n=1 Tax=Clostridium sp. TaxID=1506 RepID=UPI00261700FC|nr:M28 family metallopeptidase [Clostridium sp.]
MKKKSFYYIGLFTNIFLLVLSISLNSSYTSFSSENVKKNISVLASDTYEGRLPGSNGNMLLTEAIRIDFQNNGLVPLSDNFKENFNTVAPVKTNKEAYLNIYSKDNLIEKLTYGTDFKEDLINFRINNITFSKEDTINIYSSSIEISTDEGKCLFYITPKNDLSFRSSFISDYPYDMLIQITKDTYNKILNSLREDLTISVNVPFTTKEVELSNIVGVIKGKDSSLPPLVLTAHFDHLGKDGLNNTYYGALDNASGTSFLMELQRYLSSFKTPKRDIIFVALNAEEFGLLGSKFFVEKNIDIIKNSEVINFDMIGSEGYPLTLMLGASSKDKDSKLLDSIQKSAKKSNVKTLIEYEDSSDHASFNNLGIDSLSFCHSDLTRIHTPIDTVEFISLEAIDSAYSVINEKINNSCYNKSSIFFYSKPSVILFSISLIILLLIGAFYKIKRKNK